MTPPVTPPDRPRCPYCGEDVLVEVDGRSRRAFCYVCAGEWTPSPENSTHA